MTDQSSGREAAASEVSDSNFVLAYLPEYQNDELQGSSKERFDRLLKNHDESLLTDFATARGNFQIAFRDISLDADQLQSLRTFVEDDVSRANHEANNIKELGDSEFRGNTLRAIVLISLVFAVLYGVYVYLAPPTKPRFDALETLVYEAEVLTEDEDRLDLPTSDISEVRSYISRSPNLGFKPFLLSKIEGWEVDGATVIDYEFAKIPLVQFSHNVLKDKLFVFQYEGRLSELASSDVGKHKSLEYQTYSDENVNVIAWQASEDLMGMMIGSRGAPDMAKIAFDQMSKK